MNLEEVVAFCSSEECRREFLYAHFGFPFDGHACPRNCNCGPLTDDGALLTASDEDDNDDRSHEQLLGGKRKRGGGGDEAEPAIPKGQIEYVYQRVLSETKRLGLPKREALSRRVVQVSRCIV